MKRSGVTAAVAALCVFSSALASSDPSEPVQGVLDLDDATFDKHVNGTLPAIVEAYAPWCGHCKRMTGAVEEVGSALQSTHSHLNGRVVMAKVNADNEKKLASRMGVKGFPTIKTFRRGSSEGEDYQGQRTSSDMLSTLERLVKEDTLGRMPELDAIAMRAVKEGITSAVDEARAVANNLGTEEASAYAKVLENYKKKGNEWLDSERARIQKILDERASSPQRMSAMLDKLLALECLHSYRSK